MNKPETSGPTQFKPTHVSVVVGRLRCSRDPNGEVFEIGTRAQTIERAAARRRAKGYDWTYNDVHATLVPGHGDVRQMWIHPDDPSRRLFQTERAAQVVASGEGLNGAPVCVTVVWPVPAETDANEAAA